MFLHSSTLPEMVLYLALALVAGLAHSTSEGGEVRGRVVMPELCSPAVSPAVVYLTHSDPNTRTPTSTQLVGAAPTLTERQRGLQFLPRVQAMQIGQSIRFTNEDPETHNVHMYGPEARLNESMAPGRTIEFSPKKAGLVRVLCDIHSHMRAFVVVSPTPWFQVCGVDGTFRLLNVEPGSYDLNIWHEMGKPAQFPIAAKGVGVLDVGDVRVEGLTVPRTAQKAAPVRPWHEVIDRIGMKLNESRLTALEGALERARTLAEDAYWEEFEGSMETAVRSRLGFRRASEIEKRFQDVRTAVTKLGEDKRLEPSFHEKARILLLELHKAADELVRKGAPDSAALTKTNPAAPTEKDFVELDRNETAKSLLSLEQAFRAIAKQANAGNAEQASSLMSEAYFDAFEPLERALSVQAPLEVPRLEAKFSLVRGQLRSGAKGAEAEKSLENLLADVKQTLSGADAKTASVGAFGSSFLASLITIVREGVEVILILTMLTTLVLKSGQSRAVGAIRWGVILAILASALTAVALNTLLVSARGQAREQLEGLVMLAASAVLFYVSYWLIAQSEVKRWTEFLKRNAQKSMLAGGLFTIGATAFLAVYREGAETALMYQAMIVQASRISILGVAAGFLTGLFVLAFFYWAIKTASVRLPLRTFFKATSLTLFVMAVVFAGKGVSELQAARLIKLTPVSWIGEGVPLLGVFPTVQGLAVQGLLLAGAVLAIPSLFFQKTEAKRKDREQQSAPSAAPASGLRVS